ncbi:VCBS repeat-containing protein [Persicitalea sp.]|uniref:VCBS repeat-containing protein n=1 Tax=Persicitalea sp. TaxID=3100273 RepID=UPI003594181B
MKRTWPCIFILLATFGCKSDDSDSIFKLLSEEDTGIDFINTIQETEKDNVLNYEYFYNGGGVAAGDFNNDGLTDLYFTANQGPDRLYLNKGQLAFEDITEQAGISWNGEWKTGVTVVDLNGDGWLDIYVSVSGNVDNPALRKNKLYINNKNLTFSEKAAEYKLDLNTFTTQTTFFDYDRDGDLDAYVLNHNVKDFNRFDVQAVHAMRDTLAGDRLMRNDDGKFTDVSAEAGIKGNPIGFGLGVHVADLDGDGWPDIYVSNDYIESDYFYVNKQDGTFSDIIDETTGHTSYFSMGNDIGDINNDLLPDIVTTDMLPEDNKRQKLLFGPDRYEAYLSMLRNGFHPEIMRNMLQVNNGDGTFSEVGQVAGMSNTDWSWSPILADFDNDGYQDMFVTNGYLRDYTNMDFMKYYADERQNNAQDMSAIIAQMPSTKTPNYIFRNNQNLTFTNEQTAWGFEAPVISNGAISVDLDNDGDLEIVTNNINERAYLYQNLSRDEGKGHFLALDLTAASGQSAIGAKVYAFADSLRQYRSLTPTHGFQSSVAAPLHFGLGKKNKLDSLVVVWPDGKIQKATNVAADQLVKINYAPNYEGTFQPVSATKPLFTLTQTISEHQQQPLNDFNRQLLLLHMYSYQGPRIAKGDVNGDGLEDLYLGGGKGQPGQLWLQQESGVFTQKPQPVFQENELATDTDAVFFDADGDGDQDLFVVSGGYEYLPNDLMLQNRLYKNDGTGNFTKDYESIDSGNFSDSRAVVLDFDKDGDPDIFVAGSVIPGNYPRYNPSRLYRNNNGKFTSMENPMFATLGLLTDVCALDYDKDGYEDLVAVGEWTGIVRLHNERGTFALVQDELSKLTGFWQSIAAEDFDKDGDMDLVVGNYGLNSQLKASTDFPMTLSTEDFDNNGKLDPILSYAIQGKNHPAYSRDELSDQLIVFKKKYVTHESYATATMEDILGEFKDKTAEKSTATTLSTVYLVNNGGKFEQKPLPVQVQFAPVYALASADVNGDGYPDLIAAGNQSRSRVRIGTMDANYGQVFLNDKQGGFTYLTQKQSGLSFRGDVRGLGVVGNQLVVGINGKPFRVYGLGSSGVVQ